MCGFSGMAQLDGTVDRTVLERMGDSLFHRGPDQGGVYLHGEGALSVGPATRRLSILDLSPAGSQPMQTADGSHCIAYNGELYNEPELRRELEARGFRYRSRSDTETVLYAYQADGPSALRRFNGMFALAIHDRQRGQLILARDRMGIKPLYYTWDGQRLAFASELRTLVHHAGLVPEPDPRALDLYLTFGYVPSPYSLIRGVRKLPPGSYLVLDAEGRLSVHQFWSPAEGARTPAAYGELTTVTREVIRRAVARQMRSDVPVGVLLSGGVDSTVIATCAAAETELPLDTFSIVFRSSRSSIEDVYNADAGFARRVASTIGARHHEVVCDDGGTEDGDLTGLLRQLVAGLDEPVWELSFVSIYLMSRLARQHGIKVLLTGDGSDELFAGYPWIAGIWRQEFYERLPFLQAMLPAMTHLLPAGSRWRLHAQNLQATVGQPDVARYEHLHAIFARHERQVLTGLQERSGADAVAEVVAPLLDGVPYRSRADRVALLDLALWVREHFNQRVDRMTMLNSVEARVPFQDNEVVDLALGLSFTQKAPRGQPKRLLKEAFRDQIPEFVLRRPKRPFAAPMSAWVDGALRGFAAEMLSPTRLQATGLIDPGAVQQVMAASDPARPDRKASKLWALLMLQLWCEHFLSPHHPSASPALQLSGANG